MAAIGDWWFVLAGDWSCWANGSSPDVRRPPRLGKTTHNEWEIDWNELAKKRPIPFEHAPRNSSREIGLKSEILPTHLKPRPSNQEHYSPLIHTNRDKLAKISED